MGKYIIEVDDKYVSPDNELIVSHKNLFDGCSYHIQTAKLTPYTEPDLEQVRKEAYEQGQIDLRESCVPQDEEAYGIGYNEGYALGLEIAWEAARKILFNPDDGGMSAVDVNEVFGENSWTVMKDFSASEVVAKIKEYEDSKQKIKVGDEVECDDERYVVLQKYLNNIDELMVVLFNRRNGEINKWHLYNANGVIFKKTGRHFPEIAAILAKMKEN